jgi:protein-disulfide isomerase
MMRWRLGWMAALAVLAMGPAMAAEPEAFTPDQKRAIEVIIRDYLMNNPQVLDEAARALQAKRDADAEDNRNQMLASIRDEVIADKTLPTTGAKDADVTLIEFFDYQCEFCKGVFPNLLSILNDDKKVRYVLMELPILGPNSVNASRASIAAWRLDPKHYFDFHKAMMNTHPPLSNSTVMKLAAENGYNAADLKKEMANPAVDDMIQRSYHYAEELSISGTPAFIIGDRFIPGAVELKVLQRLLAEARGTAAAD